MYVYNYMHIWRAACNVKNQLANNYAPVNKLALTSAIIRSTRTMWLLCDELHGTSSIWWGRSYSLAPRLLSWSHVRPASLTNFCHPCRSIRVVPNRRAQLLYRLNTTFRAMMTGSWWADFMARITGHGFCRTVGAFQGGSIPIDTTCRCINIKIDFEATNLDVTNLPNNDLAWKPSILSGLVRQTTISQNLPYN